MNIFYAGGQGVKEIFSIKESEGQINISMLWVRGSNKYFLYWGSGGQINIFYAGGQGVK